MPEENAILESTLNKLSEVGEGIQDLQGISRLTVAELEELNKSIKKLKIETDIKIDTEETNKLLKNLLEEVKKKEEYEIYLSPEDKKRLKGEEGKEGKIGDVGPMGPIGKDGSPDTPEEIKNKLQTLVGEQRLDASAIKNLPRGRMGGGGITGVWVEQNFQRLFTSQNQAIATSSSPTFAGLTLSGMTLGSVLFAGTGGAITQDNANFFWDNTNNRLGIGTASPYGQISVVEETDTPTAGRGFWSEIYGAHDKAALFASRKARGTFASPTALLSGDAVSHFSPYGYKATDWSAAGRFRFLTTENWTDIATGSKFEIQTNPIGSITPTIAFTVNSDQSLQGETSLFLKEQVAALTDKAAYGQFWVETLTPNIPKFTNDAGTDFNLIQNLWATITSDSGSATANTITDTLTITGAGGIATSILGDTLTIDGSGIPIPPAQSVDLLDGNEHKDTTIGTVVRGDLITGQGVSPTWTRLALGGGGYLQSNGTDAIWLGLNIIDDITPQLGANLDANGFNIAFDTATGINDENGNEQIRFLTVAGATDYITIANTDALTAPRVPEIAIDGSSTNMGMRISTKGNGVLSLGVTGGGVGLGNNTHIWPNTGSAGSVMAFNALNTLSLVTSTVDTKFLQNAAGAITWETYTAPKDYTEKMITFTAGADGAWTDVDLSGGSYTVPANAICEIVIGNDHATAEKLAGVRTNGSALVRYFSLQEAEAGGRDWVSVHCKVDASSILEAYAETDANVIFTLVGYWA